ncbi:MAG: NYN domain-containing protein [Rhodobacteraceae bacterium]|nr:NYN domain-containing protein [Paracoccaceae bacterium]
MSEPAKRPLFAVLIDADNIPARYAEDILKEIAAFGEPALRRVYGDWSSGQLASWTKQVRELGLVAHQESANTKGKNASDIGLVIDAMDILHSGRFDGFVLVSSDSDFTALANRIREQGLEVIGIGEAKTPDSLKNVCNRFIRIENIAEVPESPTGQTAGSKSENPSGAVPLIRKAMAAIPQDAEWYTLGQIGQFLTVIKPDFDSRTYGYSKLSDLVRKLSQFELRQQGNRLEIRKAKSKSAGKT